LPTEACGKRHGGRCPHYGSDQMIKKIFKGLLLSAAFIYFALCIWLYVKQRSLLYFPTPAPANIQAQAFELQSEGLLLKGWVINPGKRQALIYFGGNGEAVEDNVEDFKQALPKVTVYLLPYRAYSGNPGEVTEANLYLDALNLFDRVKTKHDRIFLMGRSLGTGVATYLASKRRVEKLLLVTPYDSIVNVAQDKYPIFPVNLLVKDRYESWRRASDIHADVLVLIAEKDQVIPRSYTDNLLAHFKSRPKVIVFDEAGHNSISDSEKYDQVLSEFIGR
jgi:uncharacterized protein